MTPARKAEIMAHARKVMTRSQFVEYCNFLNNYESRAARNDAEIAAKDSKTITTL